MSVARGEQQFDHESAKRRNDEIKSRLPVPSAGHALGPLAGVRQRDSSSPLVFFGLSSFLRFVSRFPSSRLLPIASQVPSHFQNRGQQKLNRRSRRSRRGGIARAQAAAHFSRVRAITTGTADSVWAQRSRRSAFSICIFCGLAALRVIFWPTGSHEEDHTQSRQDAKNSRNQSACWFRRRGYVLPIRNELWGCDVAMSSTIGSSLPLGELRSTARAV